MVTLVRSVVNSFDEDWEIYIAFDRDLPGRMRLLNDLEAECVRFGAIQRGRESSDASILMYITSSRQVIYALVREIQSKYLTSNEAVNISGPLDGSRTVRASKTRSRVGDVFSIPLSSGGFGYAQYLGPVEYFTADAIRVLDLVTEGPITEVADLADVADRFPPVLTVLKVARRVYGWQLLGNLTRGPLQKLEFRHSLLAGLRGPGTYHDWQLWSLGLGWRQIGSLPVALRKLEFPAAVAPFAIADRIVSGQGWYDLCH